MYIINRTDGQIAATVNDGVADDTFTDLSLIGKNYANYGELVNENFVKLLENFANDTPPTNPLPGQLYYNTDSKKLMVFNGSIFKHINSINLSIAQPLEPLIGDMWYDDVNKQLKIYLVDSWQVLFPVYNNDQGKTGAFAETLNDALTNPHTISSIYVGSVRVAIFATEDFTPTPTLVGFGETLKKGLNLANNHMYYGLANLAANSLTLNGFTSSQFLRADANATASNLTIEGNLVANSDVYINATLFVDDVEVNGNLTVGDTLFARVISTGSSTTSGTFIGDWKLGTGSKLNSSYADLAEKYISDCELVSGMVTVFGGSAEITVTDQYADHRFAGIVSTNPAFVLNVDSEGYSLALSGRVPCRVKGPVSKGDVLTTSSIKGAAEKLNPNDFVPGCVIGKAMEDWDGDAVKIIEVAAGRF